MKVCALLQSHDSVIIPILQISKLRLGDLPDVSLEASQSGLLTLHPDVFSLPHLPPQTHSQLQKPEKGMKPPWFPFSPWPKVSLVSLRIGFPLGCPWAEDTWSSKCLFP